MSWLLFLEAIIILVAFAGAAELLSKGTEELEVHMGQGVAGGIVLGLLNALPETVVVIVAITSQSYAIAIGAALGGGVLIFTIGMGFVVAVYFMRWKKSIVMKDDYRTDFNFFLAGLIALALVSAYGRLDHFTGVALVALYVAYVLYRYETSKGTERARSARWGSAEKMQIAGYLGLGGIIIVVLSGPLVSIILQISSTINIAALWLALLVVPIAGELPEVLTGYKLARKSLGGGSTALVSFLGGKLVNLTLLIGIVGLLAPLPVQIGGAMPEFGGAVLAGMMALLLLNNGELTLREGMALGALYFIIIIFTYIF